MIKIEPKTTEISEVTTTEEVKNRYLDIHPEKPDVSEKDVMGFWDGEIRKEQDYSSVDINDKLLSEVFNRSEYELDFDFKVDDKLKAVIDRFSLENWFDLEDKEKITAIKDLVKEIGNSLGIKDFPKVELLEEQEDTLGSYNPESNIVQLNSRYIDYPSIVINTIAHEVRHAYQHERADKLETWEDALFKFNFDNYITPLPLPGGGCLFFTDYEDQYVEVDARVFANKISEAFEWA